MRFDYRELVVSHSAWRIVGIVSCLAVLTTGCFEDPADFEEQEQDDGSDDDGTTGSTPATGDTTGAGPGEDTTTDSTVDPASSSDGAALEDSTTAVADGSSTSDDPDSTDGSGSGSESGGSSSEETGPAVECGNDLPEAGEACDGAELQGASCGELGFLSGALACNDQCEFDISSCTPPPDDMFFVASGTFEMGTTDYPEESPVRDVELGPYFIDDTEVTTEDFIACVDATGCDVPIPSEGAFFIEQCNYDNKDRLQHPINCVTWELANQYCAWAGKRLPTEAEWEKAAHGVAVTTYPWGDAPAPDCTNTIMNDGGPGCMDTSTWEVGSRPEWESPYGPVDMAGNVWEWVSDWYGAYDGMDLENPTGPLIGTERVLRGGGWFHSASSDFTTTHRHEIESDIADPFIGFRCVVSATIE